MNRSVVPFLLVSFVCTWSTILTWAGTKAAGVCFHRRSCDGFHVAVKRINCSANRLSIYKKYPTNFCMEDLLSGIRSRAITCNSGLLVNVPNAVFNPALCEYNCEGDSCPVTCGKNYYASGDDNAYCTNVNGGGRWQTDDFKCAEIVCSHSTLPEVFRGQFDISTCTGNRVGSTCNMSCNAGYYATELKQTTCKKNSRKSGRWTDETFVCNPITTEPASTSSV